MNETELVVELERMLARLVDAAIRVTEGDAAAVCLLRQDGVTLDVAASAGPPDAAWPQATVALAQSPADGEALSGHPVLVGDASTDSRAWHLPGDCRSALCVPLSDGDKAAGTLWVVASAPGRFGEQEADRLRSLAGLGAVAIVAARAQARAERVEAAQARFVRVATHELRSPVAVAQSLVRAVLGGYAGKLTEKQADLFARVSRRLDYLEHLINDLLDLAAGKAPELAEEERLVLLNASVGRAVLFFQPHAEDKGLRLVHHGCCDLMAVWGTEEGLDRIFVNLVSNAVKYTPSGGHITVSVCQVDGQVQVEIADTGIGIPEKARAHLFKPFYRAPNAKALGEVGTGLGLAIVHDLVERYGGRIEVTSVPDEGTTFTVTFPIVNP